MSSAVEAVLAAAKELSPDEQLEVIEALSHSLRRRYQQGPMDDLEAPDRDAIPADVARTRPVADLNLLIADFWPENETADDLNAFIARQREEDRREG
jgi:hypothetical protein